MEIRISVAFGPRKEEDETDEREREKKNPPTLFVFFFTKLKKKPTPPKNRHAQKIPQQKTVVCFFRVSACGRTVDENKEVCEREKVRAWGGVGGGRKLRGRRGERTKEDERVYFKLDLDLFFSTLND